MKTSRNPLCIFTLTPLALTGALLIASPSQATVIAPSNGGNPLLHAIGWQTFDNAGGDNNSGISDTTPDSNSTFDDSPVGSHAAVTGGGQYLTGIIGAGASALGRPGRGQATSGSFLNGPTFGDSAVPNGMNIVDVSLADGSPGLRIGAQGQPGASSWKFRANEGNNGLHGDFSIRNESDFTFRLERIHFDVRAGNANSPLDLDLIYLAGGISNLRRADNGNELNDLTVFSGITFGTQPSVQNISQSLPGALGVPTALRLNPGDSASFRFRWSNFGTNFAESQIDNLALSGTFLDQNNAFAEINPATFVPEPGTVGLMALFGGLLFTFRRRFRA